MNTLELRDIIFQYDNQRRVFNHFSFKLKEGNNLCILGCSSSGKSTLVNILNRSVKYSGDYLLNGVSISDVNDYLISRFVKVVDKNSVINNTFVIDILFNEVSKRFDKEKDVDEEVNYIIDEFKISDILEYKFNDLTLEYKYYLLLIINLINDNVFLVIDNVLCYLRNEFKNIVFNVARKRNISILLLSSLLDESIYCDYLIFLNNGDVAMEGSVKECFYQENLLKRLGYHLPFIVDLSTQLKDYGVIKDICFKENELEEMIWK